MHSKSHHCMWSRVPVAVAFAFGTALLLVPSTEAKLICYEGESDEESWLMADACADTDQLNVLLEHCGGKAKETFCTTYEDFGADGEDGILVSTFRAASGGGCTATEFMKEQYSEYHSGTETSAIVCDGFFPYLHYPNPAACKLEIDAINEAVELANKGGFPCKFTTQTSTATSTVSSSVTSSATTSASSTASSTRSSSHSSTGTSTDTTTPTTVSTSASSTATTTLSSSASTTVSSTGTTSATTTVTTDTILGPVECAVYKEDSSAEMKYLLQPKSGYACSIVARTLNRMLSTCDKVGVFASMSDVGVDGTPVTCAQLPGMYTPTFLQDKTVKDDSSVTECTNLRAMMKEVLTIFLAKGSNSKMVSDVMDDANFGCHSQNGVVVIKDKTKCETLADLLSNALDHYRESEFVGCAKTTLTTTATSTETSSPTSSQTTTVSSSVSSTASTSITTSATTSASTTPVTTAFQTIQSTCTASSAYGRILLHDDIDCAKTVGSMNTALQQCEGNTNFGSSESPKEKFTCTDSKTSTLQLIMLSNCAQTIADLNAMMKEFRQKGLNPEPTPATFKCQAPFGLIKVKCSSDDINDLNYLLQRYDNGLFRNCEYTTQTSTATSSETTTISSTVTTSASSSATTSQTTTVTTFQKGRLQCLKSVQGQLTVHFIAGPDAYYESSRQADALDSLLKACGPHLDHGEFTDSFSFTASGDDLLLKSTAGNACSDTAKRMNGMLSEFRRAGSYPNSDDKGKIACTQSDTFYFMSESGCQLAVDDINDAIEAYGAHTFTGCHFTTLTTTATSSQSTTATTTQSSTGVSTVTTTVSSSVSTTASSSVSTTAASTASSTATSSASTSVSTSATTTASNTATTATSTASSTQSSTVSTSASSSVTSTQSTTRSTTATSTATTSQSNTGSTTVTSTATTSQSSSATTSLTSTATTSQSSSATTSQSSSATTSVTTTASASASSTATSSVTSTETSSATTSVSSSATTSQSSSQSTTISSTATSLLFGRTMCLTSSKTFLGVEHSLDCADQASALNLFMKGCSAHDDRYATDAKLICNEILGDNLFGGSSKEECEKVSKVLEHAVNEITEFPGDTFTTKCVFSSLQIIPVGDTDCESFATSLNLVIDSIMAGDTFRNCEVTSPTTTVTSTQSSTATTSASTSASTSVSTSASSSATTSVSSSATTSASSSATTSATSSATTTNSNTGSTTQTSSATTSQSSTATTSQSSSATTSLSSSVTTSATSSATTSATSSATTTNSNTGSTTQTSSATTSQSSTATTSQSSSATTSLSSSATTSATTSASSSATTSLSSSATTTQSSSATTSESTTGTSTVTTKFFAKAMCAGSSDKFIGVEQGGIECQDQADMINKLLADCSEHNDNYLSDTLECNLVNGEYLLGASSQNECRNVSKAINYAVHEFTEFPGSLHNVQCTLGHIHIEENGSGGCTEFVATLNNLVDKVYNGGFQWCEVTSPTTTQTTTVTSTQTSSLSTSASSSATTSASTSASSSASTSVSTSASSSATSTMSSTVTTSASTSATTSATSSVTSSQTSTATTSASTSASTSVSTSASSSATTSVSSSATTSASSSATTSATSSATTTNSNTGSTTQTSSATTSQSSTATTSQSSSATTSLSSSATTSVTSSVSSSATTSITSSATSTQTNTGSTSVTTTATSTQSNTGLTSVTTTPTTSHSSVGSTTVTSTATSSISSSATSSISSSATSTLTTTASNSASTTLTSTATSTVTTFNERTSVVMYFDGDASSIDGAKFKVGLADSVIAAGVKREILAKVELQVGSIIAKVTVDGLEYGRIIDVALAKGHIVVAIDGVAHRAYATPAAIDPFANEEPCEGFVLGNFTYIMDSFPKVTQLEGYELRHDYELVPSELHAFNARLSDAVQVAVNEQFNAVDSFEAFMCTVSSLRTKPHSVLADVVVSRTSPDFELFAEAGFFEELAMAVAASQSSSNLGVLIRDTTVFASSAELTYVDAAFFSDSSKSASANAALIGAIVAVLAITLLLFATAYVWKKKNEAEHWKRVAARIQGGSAEIFKPWTEHDAGDQILEVESVLAQFGLGPEGGGGAGPGMIGSKGSFTATADTAGGQYRAPSVQFDHGSYFEVGQIGGSPSGSHFYPGSPGGSIMSDFQTAGGGSAGTAAYGTGRASVETVRTLGEYKDPAPPNGNDEYISTQEILHQYAADDGVSSNRPQLLDDGDNDMNAWGDDTWGASPELDDDHDFPTLQDAELGLSGRLTPGYAPPAEPAVVSEQSVEAMAVHFAHEQGAQHNGRPSLFEDDDIDNDDEAEREFGIAHISLSRVGGSAPLHTIGEER